MTPLPKLTPEQIDEAIRLPNGSLPCGIGTTREHAVNAARATEAARDQMWIEMLAGQEPVAWSVLDKRTGKHWYTHESKYTAQHYANEYSHREPDGSPSMVVTPLYTAPQPAKPAEQEAALFNAGPGGVRQKRDGLQFSEGGSGMTRATELASQIVRGACETDPADEGDPKCIRILSDDLHAIVLAALEEQEPVGEVAEVAQGYDEGWTAIIETGLRKLQKGDKVYATPQPVKPAEQEPVLFIHPETFAMAAAHVGAWKPGHELPGYIPLYAAPQPAKQPLIADEICDSWEFITGHQIQFGPSSEGRPMYLSADEVIEFARAIERAHGIGEHE